jgi:LmbE family N-acetylglucosaminyl deacetylase
MNPYPAWLADLAKLIKKGQTLPLGGFPAATLPVPAEDAPVVLIFSPHPDDECIVGGLPLRLAREAGWRVVNIGVTCGSKRARQLERIKELRAACDYLGFELEILGEQGLEKVTAKSRDTEPGMWQEKVGQVVELLKRHQPKAILFPHAQDWNGTHIGVHHLVMDALAGLDLRQSVYLVETEFWGQNYAPNLMVEVSEKDLSDLISALTFHVGEVQRNPYHLTLPAWMMNSVRLGGETVGGQGAAPPDFLFGTVYRLRRWQGGAIHEIYQGGRVVTAHDSVAALLD